MGLPKGRTNNPNGRPRTGKAMVDILRQKLDPSDFWDKVIAMAYDGNVRCIEMISDRLCGKPMQSIETADVTKKDNVDTFKMSDTDIAAIKEIEDRCKKEKLN